MADQLETFDMSCPALTDPSAPVVIPLYEGGIYTVTAAQIVIPDGPSGLTGIALGFGGTAVVPRNPGAFISGNAENLHFDLSYYPAGVPWQAFLCNNDIRTHYWQVRLLLDLITTSVASVSPNPIPVSLIYAAAAATAGAPDADTS